MIPRAFITQWSAGAPWPTQLQVEQDLVLSRMIVELANHPVLGEELAFRGGTCLHKLHLPTALRYSEDLDYVRTTSGPVKAIMDAIRDVAESVGLAAGRYKVAGDMVAMRFEAPGEGGGRVRVKVETNIAETAPRFARERLAYAVESPWFSGAAQVGTFHVDELVATKLRALFQRRKGRDLFDLWHVLAAVPVDDERIVEALGHYMGGEVFSFPELALNLRAKLADRDFAADLDALVARTPDGYALAAAADTVMDRLGSRLRNAPPLDEIRSGGWRAG